jgi:hypothetical protein
MGDQFGISGALHSVTNMLAGAATLAIVLCIVLVVGSFVTTARGRAKSWGG